MKDIVIDEFLKFEEQNYLFERHIDDFYYWPSIRFYVYMKIEELRFQQNKNVRQGFENNMKRMFRLFVDSVIRNPYPFAKPKDVLFVTHNRKITIDGKEECIYTEQLSKRFSKESQLLDFFSIYGHPSNSGTNNLVYMDYVDAFSALHGKMFRNNKKTDEIRKISICLSEKIRQCFQVNISEEELLSYIERVYRKYKTRKRLLRAYLKKTKPKVIVETVSYNETNVVLNEVAHELNIPVIELQHGVIGSGHIAYNFARKRSDSFLPDYVFLFSEYWKNTARFAQENENLIVTGYPYLERMMNEYLPEENTSGIKRILVLSQPEFSIKIVKETEKLLDSLEENNIEYQLYYKLHPAEFSINKEIFQSLKKYRNVTLVEDCSVNLYELFAKSDIQIGVTSTALFEGAAYQLQTYILHFEKTDAYMGDMCNFGAAVMCENGEEVAKYILDGCKKHSLSKNLFFVSNALNCMEREIRKVVKETGKKEKDSFV